MEYKDLRNLALAAVRADKNAPVAYSFTQDGKTENFSLEEVNKALENELAKLGGSYAAYRENKNTIFRLIEETIDEVLPMKVEQHYMDFAEVRNVAQGDKAIFRKRITEASRKRAKTFVTKVGLAGRYETFMLDGTELEVATSAIGGAARIGFEEFLDGRIQFSELTDILVEGMDEYIYREIAKALESAVASLPAPNKAEVAGFDEATMDELLAIADTYGHSAIYCTFEFASKMVPAEGWVSGDMKNRLWSDGYLGNYKGHQVIILPQSVVDETNTTKVIDPAQAYIIPAGADKPVKLVFEGATCVREVEDNDDWSRDFQTYKKFGIATLLNHWMCSYRNTDLKKETRAQIDPVPDPEPEPPGTEAEVGDYESLASAIANPEVQKITLTANVAAPGTMSVRGKKEIDGGGKTITFSNVGQNLVLLGDGSELKNITINNTAMTETWNSTYGVQCYNGTYTLSNIKASGGNAGILVNASTVTLGEGIDVSGNHFGGIEVSKGAAGGLGPAKLIITAPITNTTEAYGQPTVWTDGEDAIVEDSTGMTSSDTVKEGQVQFYNDPANATQSDDGQQLEPTIKCFGVGFLPYPYFLQR